MTLITKEQFLEEHNKLSPAHLQATLALLDRFKEEKKPLLKDKILELTEALKSSEYFVF